MSKHVEPTIFMAGNGVWFDVKKKINCCRCYCNLLYMTEKYYICTNKYKKQRK